MDEKLEVRDFVFRVDKICEVSAWESQEFGALSAPFVATLDTSLTIPLAMLADMVIHSRHYSAIFILGCIQLHRSGPVFSLEITGSSLTNLMAAGILYDR
uniref:Uncharacterized protein n=1 Tax=Salix viminalis TaxID=40686 RepID=A0A6N2KIN1_SALVM